MRLKKFRERTLTNAFFNCFNLSVSEFGLYFRIVQVQFAHIRFVTHGSVICGFGSRIGGNGSIDGRNCATGGFAFSGHFDTGMTGTGSSSRWWRSWSSASWRWGWSWSPWSRSWSWWTWRWSGQSEKEKDFFRENYYSEKLHCIYNFLKDTFASSTHFDEIKYVWSEVVLIFLVKNSSNCSNFKEPCNRSFID